MKDFIREWSIQEKTSFPSKAEYLAAIRRAAQNTIKEEDFIYSDKTPNVIYYPRKGVTKEVLQVALKRLLQRGNIPTNLDELHKDW